MRHGLLSSSEHAFHPGIPRKTLAFLSNVAFTPRLNEEGFGAMNFVFLVYF